MKVLVLKATINEGISKKVDKSGKPYKISTVSILVPFVPREWNNLNGSGSSRGFGLDVVEIEMQPAAITMFQDFKYPCFLELETITEYRQNGAVSVVTSCAKAV